MVVNRTADNFRVHRTHLYGLANLLHNATLIDGDDTLRLASGTGFEVTEVRERSARLEVTKIVVVVVIVFVVTGVRNDLRAQKEFS